MGWSFKNSLLRMADKCDEMAHRLEDCGKNLKARSAAYETEYEERVGIQKLLKKAGNAMSNESSQQAKNERLTQLRAETKSTQMKAFGTWLLAWWMWH